MNDTLRYLNLFSKTSFCSTIFETVRKCSSFAPWFPWSCSSITFGSLEIKSNFISECKGVQFLPAGGDWANRHGDSHLLKNNKNDVEREVDRHKKQGQVWDCNSWKIIWIQLGKLSILMINYQAGNTFSSGKTAET